MTTVLQQKPDGKVTLEQLLDYAKSIGCTLEKGEIVINSDEQMALLRAWTEKEFVKQTVQ
jgi:formylmethanofuran dehydrogenase subunit C